MEAMEAMEAMEPTGEETKRSVEKHLAETENGKQRDGLHHERGGEGGHGQKPVAFLGWWPLLPTSTHIVFAYPWT